MNENAVHLPSLRASLALFLPDGEVIELRSLGAERGGVIAGYFSNRERAVQSAANLSGNVEGIYVTLNPVSRDLLARSENRTKHHARFTTTDVEVLRRRWLVVDIDPVRPRGISSTNEEHATAQDRAATVRSWLTEEGWPDPILASSGNGAHLLYRIDGPNNREWTDALQMFLRGLGARFSDERANIDAAMFNASRICRLYGTQAKKGDDTETRPHRVSRLLFVPNRGQLEVVQLGQVQALADALLSNVQTAARRNNAVLTPAVPAVPRPRLSGLDIENLDMENWFRSHECYGRLIDEERGAHAVACPWEDEHSGGEGANDTDTVIWDGRDGRLPGFRCMHSHCAHRRIHEIVAFWQDAQQFGARQRVGQDYHLTDDGNALRLIDRYGAHIRFCKTLGGWLYWNGSVWLPGGLSEIYEQYRETIQRLHEEADQIGDGTQRNTLQQHALKSEGWERQKAGVAVAAIKRPVQADPIQFDAHPYQLNCINGTIDLRTGEIAQNRPEDYCTKVLKTPYNPSAVCPRFDQFMSEVFAGDEELIDFVWRAIGYSLTGKVSEQVLFFCFGSGSNGKSTLFDVLSRLLEGYAGTAAPGLLIQSRGDRHPTEIADLRGKRFMACVETGEGQRLAEEFVKRLTGSDRIKARLMRQDFFEFDPTHKLWLSANHRPIVRGTDWAIWRRIPLIPFEVTFVDADKARDGQPIKDPALTDKLRQEMAGILAKAVRAAQDWHRNGLAIPAKVLVATESYRREQDLLGGFLEDCCDLTDPKAEEKASDVYRQYQEWCKDNGEYCYPGNKFGMTMTERGLARFKRSGNWYRGVRLLGVAEREAPLLS